jgi:formylglycine-generating enzyme required for sulfatase activity
MVSEKDGMPLMYVPAGPFLMGSNPNDAGAESDEYNQRTVTLEAFWIDKYEVTNAQYALCMADGACQLQSNLGSDKRSAYYNDPQYTDFPVIWVSWNDASAYCAWAGRRLPTEAEWEKAARGENRQTYPWGNQAPTCELANFNNCKGDTTAVGSYPAGAGPYGALDMAGNVLEWVRDWYGKIYYKTGSSENPTGPSSGQYRVHRGGAWNDYVFEVRAAERDNRDPTLRRDFIGFRCARSP